MTDAAQAPSGNAVAGPSKTNRPTPPAFRPATSFLPPNLSASSLRNASGSGTAEINDADEVALDASSASTAAGPSSGGEKEPSANGNGEAAPVPAGPVKPVHRSKSSKNAIIHSAVQRGNPVLKAIHGVPTEVGDIEADYQVGAHNGVLYLSLKYHRLHPEYIHNRIEKMKGKYQLRILMILCDVTEHQHSLRELSKIAIVNHLSTIVAWSNDEIAQYLTTFKQFENKSADTLKERVHQTFHDQLQHVLTSGKKVNKTDAANMANQFGSLANMVTQSAKMIATVKGLGPTKVTTLVDAFQKPFLVGGLKRSAEASGSTSSSGSKKSSAASQGGASKGRGGEAASGKGKGKDGDVVERRGDEAGLGSPDWPSGSDEEDEVRPARSAAGTRSRSPSSREGNPAGRAGVIGTAKGAKGAEVWRDPLDEDDAEEEEGRQGKRARVE